MQSCSHVSCQYSEELKSFRIRFQRTQHWWQTPKRDAPWSECEVPVVNGCIHIPCLLDDLGCSLWFSGLLFVGNLAITVVPLQQYSRQLDVDSLPVHPVEVTFTGETNPKASLNMMLLSRTVIKLLHWQGHS